MRYTIRFFRLAGILLGMIAVGVAWAILRHPAINETVWWLRVLSVSLAFTGMLLVATLDGAMTHWIEMLRMVEKMRKRAGASLKD